MRLARVPVAGLCGLLGCLLLAAPARAFGYDGSRGPALGLPGDSITALAAPDLRSDVSGHYRYDIEGFPGATLSQVDAIITSMLHRDRPTPSVWVLDAGSDNAYLDRTNWQPGLDTELHDVSGASRVVLVTINTNADRPSGNGIAQAINEALFYVHDVDPSRYVVMNWNALVHQHPGWLRPDGIHPNATGDAHYAAGVARALGLAPSGR